MFGHALGCAEFAVAELGKFMEIATPFQHLGIDRFGPGLDIGGLRGYRRQQCRGHGKGS